MADDQIFEKNGKQYSHCLRNTLLPYEFVFARVSCGYNIIKQKHELSKLQRRKNLCIDYNMLNKKTFCICVDVCQVCDVVEQNKIIEVLSK